MCPKAMDKKISMVGIQEWIDVLCRVGFVIRGQTFGWTTGMKHKKALEIGTIMSSQLTGDSWT
jgi:hypothetical protein